MIKQGTKEWDKAVDIGKQLTNNVTAGKWAIIDYVIKQFPFPKEFIPLLSRRGGATPESYIRFMRTVVAFLRDIDAPHSTSSLRYCWWRWYVVGIRFSPADRHPDVALDTYARAKTLDQQRALKTAIKLYREGRGPRPVATQNPKYVRRDQLIREQARMTFDDQSAHAVMPVVQKLKQILAMERNILIRHQADDVPGLADIIEECITLHKVALERIAEAQDVLVPA